VKRGATLSVFSGAVAVLPALAALLISRPFSVSVSAAPNQMLGPNYPPIFDTNGNGRPDAGDEVATLKLSGATLNVGSLWNCNPTAGNNVITFSNPNGAGQYQAAGRPNGGLNQSIQLISGTSANFNELLGGVTTASGSGQLVDTDGDGLYDTLLGTGMNGGSPVSFSLSLVGVDTNGDGHADYLSFPWSQTSVIGVDFSASCGSPQPQVWIVLTDTDGDGIPDSIVLDLNGDGVADQQFVSTPRLEATGLVPVPTLGMMGRLLLIGLLGGFSLWALRRREQITAI
jgi:hypothetical protein